MKADLNVETHLSSPHSFIGMTLTRDRKKRSIKVTMGALVDKLIESYAKDLKIAVTPATQAIVDPFENSDLTPLKPVRLSEFVTIVMTLLFIARFVRPDILLPVTLLACRLKTANELDHSEAIRIVRYLKGTRDIGLVFEGPAEAIMRFFVDASHGLINGRGIGAFIVTLGAACILARCWFLKFITLSSTESEICAMTESITYVLWMRRVLGELGHAQEGPTVIYQDNEAAIRMQNAGAGTFKRSKHLLAKAAFCTEQLQDGTATTAKIDTEDMLCDMLTKVMNGPSLQRNMRSAFMR